MGLTTINQNQPQPPTWLKCMNYGANTMLLSIPVVKLFTSRVNKFPLLSVGTFTGVQALNWFWNRQNLQDTRIPPQIKPQSK